MIITREVTGEDAAIIAGLSRQLGYTISVEQTLQNINALLQSEQHAVFVAVDDKVIGWTGVSYSISPESPPLCEIHKFYEHLGFTEIKQQKVFEISI